MKHMSKPVLGAQLYTCRDFTRALDAAIETLKKVAAIGYTAVQVSGFGPVDFKEVGKAAEDLGLTVAATHVKWPRFLNDLDAVIEEQQHLKCEHPAVGMLPREYHTLDGVGRFLDELAPIAERLAAAGMDFSYHNHSHELVRFEGRTWLERLYERADPNVLKAEIDTYWITYGGGDPAAWIRTCAGREPLVHFKDMIVVVSAETPWPEQRMAEIGEGNLNWPAILDACRAGGVRWFLIEQDDCYGRSPFECLATSYRNLAAMGLR
jgi:sugar phosphate isomerase/epimerase